MNTILLIAILAILVWFVVKFTRVKSFFSNIFNRNNEE